MQNKPNLLDAQMNISSLIRMRYENLSDWTLSENKPNFKPDAYFSAYYTRDCTALRDSFGGFHFECRNGKIAQITLISGLLLSQVWYVPA